MTNAELLAEIERLEKAATPGPWRFEFEQNSDETGEVFCSIARVMWGVDEELIDIADAAGTWGYEDIILLVTLRNNLPAILSDLRGVGAARVALKPFLFRRKDEDGHDMIDGLPDGHGYELIFSQGDGEEDDEGCGRCDVTAGQIRRARAAFAALSEVAP